MNSLDNLRKAAKRWLKDLRASNSEARARFEDAWPGGPAQPVLRDVQHALAREHGYESWKALKQAIEKQVIENQATENQPIVASSSEGHREHNVNRFLEYACPDHHVRGRPAHRVARHAAMRVLEQHAEVALENVYAAVVCGEIEEVRRLLSNQPELANQKNIVTGRVRSGVGGSYDFLQDFGSKDWQPLLYLTFTRLPLAKANDNAVNLARLLLDYGADPNVYFMAGDSRYTPLVGAIGEGEEDRPPHPHRDELVRLLLERGAAPYDDQVIYNIAFHGKVLWYLKLMHEFSSKAGRAEDWDDPEWRMLNMGGYGSGARWHLSVALNQNDLALAEWCLQHGASPNAAPASDTRLPKQSLYELALRGGHLEMAELLARYGADRVNVVLDAEDAFVAACLRLDREEVQRILNQHPEYLHSHKAMIAAAKEDRADVVSFLLELGTPIEVEDEKKQRALHVAAWADALRVAELLIERGAELDPRELNYSNTPLDFAVYAEHTGMIELLSRHSRDVWNLVFVGAVGRLREVLAAEPRLARVSWQTTPLFWLPEQEETALQIAGLLLEHGADAGFLSQKDGSTAADVARKRGMHRVAKFLEGAAANAGALKKHSHEYLLNLYEQLASDLVTVYSSDDTEALERLARHFDRILSFSDIRKLLRKQLEHLRRDTGGDATTQLDIADARDLIARQSGFENWNSFLSSRA